MFSPKQSLKALAPYTSLSVAAVGELTGRGKEPFAPQVRHNLHRSGSVVAVDCKGRQGGIQGIPSRAPLGGRA